MLKGLKAAAAAALLLWAMAAVATPTSPSALVFCGGGETAENVTVLGLGWGGAPLPAPEDGVVTAWGVSRADRKFEQRLQVFRRVDGPVDSFLAVAESSARMAGRPSSIFKTRIPVKAGDLFALRGTTQTFLCRGVVGIASGLHEGPTPVGSSYEFRIETGLGVPLGVRIEPDEDGDGYGDWTQDSCTRVPTQNGCPAVKLRVEEALARVRSILLRVTVATKAEVRIYGDVTYPQRLPGQSGDVPVTESIDSASKTVQPGKATGIGLKLPRRLQRHLKERLRPLEVDLSVLATSVAGRAVERELTVRLPGLASR
jgi:hypothetical protein